MNTFLQQLKITFRRDPTNARSVASASVRPALVKLESTTRTMRVASHGVWLTYPFLRYILTLLLRPRINKLDSVKDREQKASGNYFFMEGGEGDDNTS